ncbi:YdiU family protein [Colwellia sp. BRX8-8]|nr:YdiU family protein [Colwellia sp. BRX8-8]
MSYLDFNIENSFSSQLPEDLEESIFPHQVHAAAFSWVSPKRTSNPQLVTTSRDVASILGLSEEQLKSDEFLQLFTGNVVPEEFAPYAMCYGGHQFGHWAGQLGDGRAINLAEVNTPLDGHKVLQLKGAGPTPFSRTADGLAVLRSSVREFLCSEAMFHLGIPTTRALSLSLTGDSVVRDMFYNGNAKAELGAVVCRVSSSFMRFGSIELPAYRKDKALLKQLVDYSIKRDFPHLLNDHENDSVQGYLAWFDEIAQRTCRLMVHWMRVGFVHGVMNTDNMSLIGETIDYGPYGWIDNFDLSWTPNTTDAQGKRYSFGKQGEISQWNLFQLANAIYPLIEESKPLEVILNNYSKTYQQQWHEMMSNKLGITAEDINHKADTTLFLALESLLGDIETDMTIFYRLLADFSYDKKVKANNVNHFADCFYLDEQLTPQHQASFSSWLENYANRIEHDEKTAAQRKAAIQN